MKFKFFLLFLSLTSSIQVFCQTTEEATCYDQWRSLFKTRGADVVTDDSYEFVIVTLRNGNQSNCYNGRAVVGKGMIKEVQIKLVDGEFESILFNTNEDYQIIKGVSETMDGRIRGKSFLVNIFFKTKLKPKKQNY